MAVQMRGIIMVAIVMSFISVASAIAGTASFYTNYNSSVCYGNQDQGVLVAAANNALYANGAGCGRMYRVTCTGPTRNCRGNGMTVKIVDSCPSPCQSTFDLSQEAFLMIATPTAGRIDIDIPRFDALGERGRVLGYLCDNKAYLEKQKVLK